MSNINITGFFGSVALSSLYQVGFSSKVKICPCVLHVFGKLLKEDFHANSFKDGKVIFLSFVITSVITNTKYYTGA